MPAGALAADTSTTAPTPATSAAVSAPEASAPSGNAAAVATAAPAAIHPEVQRALDYQLPVLPCEQPKFISSHGVFQSNRNLQRLRRYFGCLNEHTARLAADFDWLKNSVRHGVTPDQANRIGNNLVGVRRAIQMMTNLANDAQREEAFRL
jgi:hypothetical protein